MYLFEGMPVSPSGARRRKRLELRLAGQVLSFFPFAATFRCTPALLQKYPSRFCLRST